MRRAAAALAALTLAGGLALFVVSGESARATPGELPRGEAAAIPAATGEMPAATDAIPLTGSLHAQWENTEYDGRFTFVRIHFESGGGGLRGFGRRGSRGEPPWAHDFPRAERNFMQIITETTLIRPFMEGGNVFPTDDPELTRFPLAYLSEPGFWVPDEEEVEGLRNYLLKGGFLIADDFRDRDWFNFEEQMRRVIPGAELVQLDESHEIFDSFFRIDDLEGMYPPYGGQPVFYGLHEDNDPSKRLMVIANYNNDIGEFWEFSDTGWYPIDLSNDAYKLGVNYVIYAMTH